MKTRTHSALSQNSSQKFIGNDKQLNMLPKNLQNTRQEFVMNDAVQPSRQQMTDFQQRLAINSNHRYDKYQALQLFLTKEQKKLRIKPQKNKEISLRELKQSIRQIIKNSTQNTKQETQKSIKEQLICYFKRKSFQQYSKVNEICMVFQFLKEEIDFSYVTSKYSNVQPFKIWIFDLVNHVYELINHENSQNSKKIPNYLLICQKIEQKIQNRSKIINKIDKIQKKTEIIQQKSKENKWSELSNDIPVCPNKQCGSQMEDRRCNNGKHSIVFCSKCAYTSHQCLKNNNPQFITEIRINAIGQRVHSFPVGSLAPENFENNIKQVVKNQGYDFVSEQKIIKGVPKIKCSYPVLVGKSRDLVYKNRQVEHLLPLQIKPSKIQSAGLGVFATKNIEKKDLLICSYLGEIGRGSQTPNERNGKANDSIFTLGWIGQEILILAPNKYSNVGRYINFNRPELCNLKPNLCLIERKPNDYQIAVLLTTIKKIKAGEQLYYCYGQDYKLQ